MSEEDFCRKTRKSKTPKSCSKNLGIKRINMPQINSPTDYKKLKDIVNHRLKLNSEEKDIKVKNNIYASQKEINVSRAEDIIEKIIKTKTKTRKNKKRIPVILLKDSKNFLVVDGHHRWLAYHLLNKKNKSRRKYKMNSYIIHVKDITTGFKILNNTLLKDKHRFHKRHTFKNTNK
jgi:hypothetical protein